MRFDTEADRDAYFFTDVNNNRLGELFPGLNIIVGADMQFWSGVANPGTYAPGSWSTSGVSIDAATVLALFVSNANAEVLRTDKLEVLNHISVQDGRLVFDLTGMFPSNSVGAGDALFEAGGRSAVLRSLSTGLRAVLISQLFGSGGFSKPTFADDRPVPAIFDVQTSDFSVASGVRVNEFRQVVQSNVQTNRFIFMPEGGVLPAGDWSFSLRLADNAPNTYDTVITPGDTRVSSVGLPAGQFAFTVADNPSGLDAGFNAIIRTEGISLLGGNGFDGSIGTGDGTGANDVLFGDADNNNFFMFLRTDSLVLNRLPIASERFVAEAIAAINYHVPVLQNFAIDIPGRVDLDTDLNVSKRITFNAHNSANLSSLNLVVTVGDDIPVGLPINDGVNGLDVLLAGIDTSSAGSLVFRLEGVDSNGDAVHSNSVTIQLANVQAHEYLYYGYSDSNNPAVVDVNTLSQIEAVSGDINIALGNPTLGQRLIILAPADHAVQSIINTATGFSVLGSYETTNNVRQIGSVNYNSHVLGASQGLTAVFSANYRIILS